MKHFNVTFAKHFNADGEGDDYPTDKLIVSRNVDINPLFIEMIPPATFADVPCDDCWGTETWNYSVEDEHAGYFESLLQNCDTVTAFEALP